MKKNLINKISHQKGISDIPYFGRIVSLLFLLAGLLIYSTSMSNPFIWDDFDLVIRNANIKGWVHFFDLFKGNVVEQSSFYRPVQMFTYLLDYEIWKLNPKGFHLTSILIHVAVSLSLCWFVITLFSDRLIGILAGLLFLVHPIHNEAVVYISGRADPLVALFILLCLTFYVRYHQHQHWLDYTACVITLIFALLSKEYALIIPGFLVVYHIALSKKIIGRLFYVIVALVGLYFLLRMFNIVGVADMHSKTQTILIQRMGGAFFAMYEYIRLLVLPYNLFLGYGQKIFPWNNILVWLGLLIYVGMVAVTVRSRRQNGLICFAFAWYLVGLAPVMNVYPINAYMAEHWLYMPSMGAFIFVAWVIQQAYRRVKSKDVVIAICSIVFLLLSVVSVRQNFYWRDPIVFYKRIIEINPRFVKAYNNLGKIYSNQEDYVTAATYFKESFNIEPRFEKGYHNYAVCLAKMHRVEEAIEYYKQALQINPNFAPTYNNLGALYIDLEQFDKAEIFVAKALSIKSDIPKAYYNLGIIEQKRGNENKAIRYFQQALKLDGQYTSAKNNLGAILSRKGRTDIAIQFYLDSLNKDPDNYTTLNNVGVLYGKKGDVDRSIEYFAKALSVKSDYADAHFNIAYAFAGKGSFGQAMRHYQDAIKYNPKHVKAINNLAIIYAGQGRYGEAEQLFTKALELEPNDLSTHNNLGLILARQNKFDQATTHYQKVLTINPNHKETHNNLAMLYDELGKIKEAENHYLEALKLDPQFTNALNGLGIVYGKSKRYKDAEGLFLKALEVNPNGRDALNNLKRARALMKQEGI